MNNNIHSKRYYRVTFQLASALAIGGSGDHTDKDIVLNSKGIPYIPATSLAGVYATLFDETTRRYYFGEAQQEKESKLIIYDANVVEDEWNLYRIGKRDCVGLDEYKTAIDGAKFDFEILEPGVSFVTYIELDKYAEDENEPDLIAQAWTENVLQFGAKGARGLGKIKNAQVEIREFQLDQKEELENWLDFDVYSLESWNRTAINYAKKMQCSEWKGNSEICKIELKLRQTGPLMIRSYQTTASTDCVEPDYQQLCYMRENNGKIVEIPVIPGTSWAGAFRHHLEALDQGVVGDFFGKESVLKSRIFFGESELTGSKKKVRTRNSIDSFTGGGVERALFTEQIVYGGHTQLEIRVEKPNERLIKALCATILDLHHGILSIGGETAVGYGLFSIQEIMIQGKQLKPEEDIYNQMVQYAMENVGE